jgi:hypothetical protein
MMKNVIMLSVMLAVAASSEATAGVTVTSAYGVGADTYVTNSLFPPDSQYYNPDMSPDNNFGSDPAFLVRYWSGVRASIGFLRFDISGVTGDMSEAILSLASHPIHGVVYTSNLAVYGLKEDYDIWDESTITYNNAPGLLSAPVGEYALEATKLVRLGVIACISNTLCTSDPIQLDISSFISSDTDKKISLLIVKESSDSSEWAFRSKEKTGVVIPTLTLPNAVPEPATISLIALGGVALLRRRRAGR